MMTLQFSDTHNLVSFLAKPAKSEGFEQVVDFLNAHTIKYALTVNPTIYTLCIKQFWATIKVKTINEEQQLQALVDGKKIVNTEASVRRDLQSGKTTAWNEFSSTMASAIICLATNKKFNFSKYIFESIVKNLDNAGKFLMYPSQERSNDLDEELAFKQQAEKKKKGLPKTKINKLKSKHGLDETKLVEESSKKAKAEIAQESSSKRAGTELEQESIKKQKVDEDKETTKLQRLIEIVLDKEEVAIDAIPFATKPPSIVDYKIHKEGRKPITR
ncbi:hypothetical protein Tco_0088460 [Tanacetum coccineum]